jgi:restriction system protein
MSLASRLDARSLKQRAGGSSPSRCVLVTTSWVGIASREFAARNGRIEIIEGRHLKSLLLEPLGKDVLIGPPTLPPGWERREIT